MSNLKVNAREFALSGQHDYLATLRQGVHFRGIYVIREKPTLISARGEECYTFWIDDMSGRMHCTIPVYRVIWQDAPEFRSQRLLIEAYAEKEGVEVVGRVKTLEPVHMVW